MYPEYIEIQGKKYKINTDYRVALSCFKAINDETINDMQRAITIVVLLLGKDFPLEHIEEALKKCSIYLRCGKEENTDSTEVDMDYEQDRPYLMASFMSCYRIDINKENLHWWAFNDLIAGFGEQEIMSKIREIRNRNPYEEKDLKLREKIIKAQNSVALKQKKSLREKELDKQWEEMLRKEGD